jgi:hypothetical protein
MKKLLALISIFPLIFSSAVFASAGDTTDKHDGQAEKAQSISQPIASAGDTVDEEKTDSGGDSDSDDSES